MNKSSFDFDNSRFKDLPLNEKIESVRTIETETTITTITTTKTIVTKLKNQVNKNIDIMDLVSNISYPELQRINHSYDQTKNYDNLSEISEHSIISTDINSLHPSETNTDINTETNTGTNNVTKLELRKFTSFEDHNIFLIIGKKGSGTSTMALHLANQLNIDLAYIVGNSDFYNKHQKRSFAFGHLDDGYKTLSTKSNLKRALILEKPGSLKDLLKDRDLVNLFFNAHSLGIYIIIIDTWINGIPPHLRSNIDCIMMFQDNNRSAQKQFYDYYANCFPNFSAFQYVYKLATKNYGCLLIDNRSNSDKLEDLVFWYKV